ncbi:MAG: hypothetical protein AAF212_02550 [Verrucomicrobiota bacterium]
MNNGSTGNVIAAVCSFFIPGMGQLVQGRWFKALVMCVLTPVMWVFLLGWLIHLWSVLDAACYEGPMDNYGYPDAGALQRG